MINLSQFEKFKDLYLLEQHRLESFKSWPFDDSSSCSIAKMAAAGFYWVGNNSDNDTVTCFVCGKTLDGWEVTDDPWKEHANHAPQCMFVKYGRSEGNLLVEEFISIFDIVIKNEILKNVQEMKKQFSVSASEELDSFLGKK